MEADKIGEEMKRMSEIFSDLSESEKSFLAPMIQNAAFMKVTLDSLQEQILQSGCVDEYNNGNQNGLKTSAAMNAYNSLVKNYNALMVKLKSFLPKEKKKSAMTELMEKYG